MKKQKRALCWQFNFPFRNWVNSRQILARIMASGLLADGTKVGQFQNLSGQVLFRTGQRTESKL